MRAVMAQDTKTDQLLLILGHVTASSPLTAYNSATVFLHYTADDLLFLSMYAYKHTHAHIHTYTHTHQVPNIKKKIKSGLLV